MLKHSEQRAQSEQQDSASGPKIRDLDDARDRSRDPLIPLARLLARAAARAARTADEEISL